MQIFITRGEDSSGPYTLEQVRDYLSQGVLLPDDFAYHEGLEGWIRLEQLISESAPMKDPLPPAQEPAIAPPSSEPEPVVAPMAAAAAPASAMGKGKGKNIIVLAAVVGLLVLSALGVGGWFLLKDDPVEQVQNQKPGKPPPATGTPEPNPNLPPPPTTTPSTSALADTLIDKRMVIGLAGNEHWVQLNSDGTSLDKNGLTGTFMIEGLTVTIRDDDGVSTAEFATSKPQPGDMVVITSRQKTNPSLVRGTIKAKIVKLTAVNDLEGTASNPSTQTEIPGTVLWEFVTGGEVHSSPAIGPDGTVYVGSHDNKLYAVNGKTGDKLWEFETGGSVSSSPAIGSDGTVYIGSNDRKLYAVNGKSGVKLWEFETGGYVQSSPAIGPDGTVYVGALDKKLYAINGKTGDKLWEFETGSLVRSSPAIGTGGTVYIGSNDKKLYALNGKSGDKLWEFVTGGVVESSLAIGSDGTVYVGSIDNKLYALSGKTGAKLWEFKTGSVVGSSPAIGADGTVYVGSDKLYAINGKTGDKLWEFETGGYVSPGMASTRSAIRHWCYSTVYVGSWDKKLYALSGKTGDKLWEFETGGVVRSSPAIGTDGTLYVGSSDKKLYAFRTDSKGLAKSPWPMRGQNAQHTGRAMGSGSSEPTEPNPTNPEPTTPTNGTLTELLTSKRLRVSIEGDEFWVQLNNNGTTLDHAGLEGTFKIEGMSLSITDDDGITIIEFTAANPKEGDAVTVTGTKEPGSPPVLGPIKAKIVKLGSANNPEATSPKPPETNPTNPDSPGAIPALPTQPNNSKK